MSIFLYLFKYTYIIVDHKFYARFRHIYNFINVFLSGTRR